MDEDLECLTRQELIDEVKRLRAAIRAHRDSTQHQLCWYHPQLWGLLPEKTEPSIVVPDLATVHAWLPAVSRVLGCPGAPRAAHVRGVFASRRRPPTCRKGDRHLRGQP